MKSCRTTGSLLCPPLDSVLHALNFVISCDQVSHFCTNCKPIHALLRHYSTPCSRCFGLSTDFTIGILQIMGEHVVTRFWLGTEVSFLTLGLLRQSVSHRITTEGGSLSKGFFLDTVHGVAPCSRSRYRRIVVIQSFSERFSICVVTATMVTKFPMLQSITLLPLDNLGLKATRKKNQVHHR